MAGVKDKTGEVRGSETGTLSCSCAELPWSDVHVVAVIRQRPDSVWES